MASTDDFRFFGLGGCNEVGRSCHIIEYKNKVIMLDAGIHPAMSGHSAFPFYDEYDLEKVDILLISHFHLDHAASLPYVMQHTRFRGKVFMTHATKAIYRWLVKDFVSVTSIGGDRSGDEASNLYSHEDIMSSLDGIETIDFHSTMELNGVRFTAYHAGHVLGACMYLIEIGGLKILFTGDYSRTENRHLHAAEVPQQRPDILICESTFGTGTLEPRAHLESKLVKSIHATIARGGRVLLPVFALGNAQELLLILDEYWRQHDELQGINIYFASSLARKCMAVYQTYTSIMNDNIRLTSSGANTNPFDFKFVKMVKDLSRFNDFGPSVMVAAPGMLQAGVSRQLLERWAPDPKNLCVLTGYSVEGTMAKEILKEPATIPSVSNPDVTIARNINVEEISFAAHVDFQENTEFIDKVQPSKIILVHGDSVPMGRLKSALLSKYAARKGSDKEVKVFNPKNCEEVLIGIKGNKTAKVLGGLAEEQLVGLRSQFEEAKVVEIKQEEMDVDEEAKGEAKVEEATVKQEPGVKKEEEEKEDEKEKEKDEKSEESKDEKPKESEDSKDESKDESKSESKSDKSDDTNPEYVTTASNQLVRGVLVAKDFDLNLLQLQDLHEYTNLSTSIVKSKINLKINADVPLVQWHLEQMFGYVNVVTATDDAWECVIMDMIVVSVDKTKGALLVVVEWINDNLMADSLADSVVAILYSIDSSPASVKKSSQPCGHSHGSGERLERIAALLRSQFGDALTVGDHTADIKMGKLAASIDLHTWEVTCASKVLKDRVETIVRQGSSLTAPLAVAEKA
ncbi:endoribonuclease Ysh1p [Diutina catenulata]